MLVTFSKTCRNNSFGKRRSIIFFSNDIAHLRHGGAHIDRTRRRVYSLRSQTSAYRPFLRRIQNAHRPLSRRINTPSSSIAIGSAKPCVSNHCSDRELRDISGGEKHECSSARQLSDTSRKAEAIVLRRDPIDVTCSRLCSRNSYDPRSRLASPYCFVHSRFGKFSRTRDACESNPKSCKRTAVITLDRTQCRRTACGNHAKKGGKLRSKSANEKEVEE